MELGEVQRVLWQLEADGLIDCSKHMGLAVVRPDNQFFFLSSKGRSTIKFYYNFCQSNLTGFK